MRFCTALGNTCIQQDPNVFSFFVIERPAHWIHLHFAAHFFTQPCCLRSSVVVCLPAPLQSSSQPPPLLPFYACCEPVFIAGMSQRRLRVVQWFVFVAMFVLPQLLEFLPRFCHFVFAQTFVFPYDTCCSCRVGGCCSDCGVHSFWPRPLQRPRRHCRVVSCVQVCIHWIWTSVFILVGALAYLSAVFCLRGGTLYAMSISHHQNIFKPDSAIGSTGALCLRWSNIFCCAIVNHLSHTHRNHNPGARLLCASHQLTIITRRAPQLFLCCAVWRFGGWHRPATSARSPLSDTTHTQRHGATPRLGCIPVLLCFVCHRCGFVPLVKMLCFFNTIYVSPMRVVLGTCQTS